MNSALTTAKKRERVNAPAFLTFILLVVIVKIPHNSGKGILTGFGFRFILSKVGPAASFAEKNIPFVPFFNQAGPFIPHSLS